MKKPTKKPTRSRLIEADALATPLVNRGAGQGKPSPSSSKKPVAAPTPAYTPNNGRETEQLLRVILDQYRDKTRELLSRSFPGSLPPAADDSVLLSGLESIIRSFGPQKPAMPGPSKVKRR